MVLRQIFYFLLGISLAFGTGQAGAQSSIGDIVRIDVLDGGTTKRGTVMGALRLTLSDGWKTYWRAPGDAGIPPKFDWSGSRNVGDLSIIWPTPVVFDQSGYRSIGYKRQLVLPVEITPVRPDQPVRLKGRMAVGVCKDVCVPGDLHFDHQLDAQAGRNPAIAAALAQRPYSEAEAGVTAAVCRVSPTRDGLAVEVRISMPSAGAREIAVIEPGIPNIRASQTKAHRSGNTLVASTELVHASDAAYALDRSRLRVTVIGQKRTVDIRGCAPG